MNKYSYTFDAFGKSISISGNWSDCLKDISVWYALPQIKISPAPELSIEISGADEKEIDRLLPLHPLLRHPGSVLYKETGNRFFETHYWTRENVLRFYNEDVFSKVSPQERNSWAQLSLAPFHKRHHRLIRYKLNPLTKWPQMLYEALARRLKKLFAK